MGQEEAFWILVCCLVPVFFVFALVASKVRKQVVWISILSKHNGWRRVSAVTATIGAAIVGYWIWGEQYWGGLFQLKIAANVFVQLLGGVGAIFLTSIVMWVVSGFKDPSGGGGNEGT